MFMAEMAAFAEVVMVLSAHRRGDEHMLQAEQGVRRKLWDVWRALRASGAGSDSRPGKPDTDPPAAHSPAVARGQPETVLRAKHSRRHSRVRSCPYRPKSQKTTQSKY